MNYDVNYYSLKFETKIKLVHGETEQINCIIWFCTGRSKCYGFVRFGDVYEHAQAMTEMNGAYCSTRPMRIGPAPNNKGTHTFLRG